jgi:hypothetical protein
MEKMIISHNYMKFYKSEEKKLELQRQLHALNMQHISSQLIKEK